MQFSNKLLGVLVLTSVVFTAAGVAQSQTVLYVDDSSTNGLDDGSDWGNAFVHLQDALACAGTNGEVEEIRVAQGLYKPDQGAAQPPGDREASFHLLDGVAIKGGYGAPAPDLRDVDSNASILSGDLSDNDADSNGCEENSYHVVTGSDTESTAVLDGFTITAGYADGVAANADVGGGMFTLSGDPTVIDCTFRDNFAVGDGGGMWHWGGCPTIRNCTFRNNHAVTNGGGMYFVGDSPQEVEISDCLFMENSAGFYGGGGLVGSDNGTLINCKFVRNLAAHRGGGIHVSGATITDDRGLKVTNCTFVGNVVSGTGYQDGGGALNQMYGRPALVTNCTFYGNSSGNKGGAVYNLGSATWPFYNCIFWGNTAPMGPQIAAADAGRDPELVVVSHCNIQGGQENIFLLDVPLIWEDNNIDVDPLLTPDGHLRAGSPCVNAGSNGFLPADTIDLDGDGNTTETVPFDLDGDDRVIDGWVDMGADEFFDSDSNGLPDWWEGVYFSSTRGVDPDGDDDGDGLTNLDEYAWYGSNPAAPPYYVDANGDDAWDGLGPFYDPVTSNGPKRTIQAAIDAAGDGDTVLVIAEAGTTYAGVGNFELDFGGKALAVRKCDVPGICDDPGVATIDCGGAGRVADVDSIEGVFTVLEGFTITGGQADIGGGVRAWHSRLALKDCLLTGNSATAEGGGFHIEAGTPTLSSVSTRTASSPAPSPSTVPWSCATTPES